MTEIGPLGPEVLPEGVRSRFVDGINGLRIHVLEAGYEGKDRPCVLLLHGFPEIAYSWRKVMPALAAAGYHVVAHDQRGYGRTTGWSANYDTDLRPFRALNLVRDALGLIYALGYRQVSAVVGHDAGAGVAAWAALVRPDVFRSVVLMSAPFAGPPALPFGTANEGATPQPPGGASIHDDLAALPRPRKHYHWYYSTREANADMWHAPQGVHDFLRGYYHHKSADWKANRPFTLKGWTAEQLAQLPTYYVMDRDRTMAETVAAEMPRPEEVAACSWLTDAELRVYSGEYGRTGFQGGLQWYRCRTSGLFEAEHQLFADRTIDVPSRFIAGASDWGIHQTPGALEKMFNQACTAMDEVYLIEGAGHWVQQERSDEVNRSLLDFLSRQR